MSNKTLYKNKLSTRWHKLLLTIHVVISLGVIGADLTVVILGITGLTSGIPELILASYIISFLNCREKSNTWRHQGPLARSIRVTPAD